MARFINTKNNRIVELLSIHPKTKNAQVQYVDDGTTVDYSPSTWHRWWRELKEDEVPVQEEEVVEEQQTVEEPEVAGDGTPYTQVMEEILQDEKQAAEKKASNKKAKEPKEKKPRTKKTKITRPTFDSTQLQTLAIDTVEKLGGSFKQRTSKGGTKESSSKVFRDANNHMFAHMHYSKYQMYLDTRGVDTEQLAPDATVTGFYSVRFYFTEDNKEMRDKLKKVLTQAYKTQLKLSRKGDK